MLAASHPFENETAERAMAYGISQFLGILAALAFVVAADAYRQRPRFQPQPRLGLLPVAI